MKKGFTLIELLVAISIIAALSIIGLTTYQGITTKARDSIRKNDLSTLATALEIYFQKNGKYIGSGDGTQDKCADTDTFYNTIASYINGPVPKDPKGAKYCYQSLDRGLNYKLYAKLENCKDALANKDCEYIKASEEFIAAQPSPSPPPPSPPPPPPPPPPTPTPSPSPSLQSCFISISGIRGAEFPALLAAPGNSYSIRGSLSPNFNLKITDSFGAHNHGTFTPDDAYILDVGSNLNEVFTIKIDNGIQSCSTNIRVSRTEEQSLSCIVRQSGTISTTLLNDTSFNPTQPWPQPSDSVGQSVAGIGGPGLNNIVVILEGQASNRSCNIAYAQQTSQTGSVYFSSIPLRVGPSSRISNTEKVYYTVRIEKPNNLTFTRGICFVQSNYGSIDDSEYVNYLKTPQQPSCQLSGVTPSANGHVIFGLK